MSMIALNSKSFLTLLVIILTSCSTLDKKNQPAFTLERHVNVRYTFSLLIPTNFHQTFSENGDGIILSSTKHQGVEVVASGSHNALFHTLEEEVLQRSQGEEVIFQENFKVHNAKTNQLMRGVKIVSKKENIKIIRIVFLHQTQDVFYSVRCQAPQSTFNDLQPLFNMIIASFKLTDAELERS